MISASSVNFYKSKIIIFYQIFEDISGNCFVENPFAPSTDTGATKKYFSRTSEQDATLCIYSEQTTTTISDRDPSDLMLDLQGEVMQFGTNCPDCNAPCMTNMKVTSKCIYLLLFCIYLLRLV